jgi:hypothetical protein
MEYGPRWPSDEDHARKQFKSSRRNRILKKLREGGWNSGEVPQIETIEHMVCVGCRTECRKLREETQHEERDRERARQQKVEQDQITRQRHYEWRDLTADEIDRTTHATEFRAVFPDSKPHEIVFRWRAQPGKCRGADSYLMKVGMWVDGKLTAHYFGWNLQHADVDADRDWYCSEDEWPTSDLFGRGFCLWIEHAFQPLLLRLKPDWKWTAKGNTELEIETQRPGTLLIKWLDGTSYVNVLPSQNLPEVAEWAERNLRLRIEERAFRPVWTRESTEEESTEEE